MIRKRPTASRQGYVLLMVLVAIIVSGVALTRLANTSATLAADAVQMERKLQRDWANKSISVALLPRVRDVFDARDDALGRILEARPPAIAADQIRLGECVVSVIIADENAKTNLNSLYHANEKHAVEQELQRVLSPGFVRAINLRPAAMSARTTDQKSARSSEEDDDDDEETPAPPRAFRSWGEVFDFAAIENTFGSDREIASIAKELTLWGNGRLNVARASDGAFLSACRPIVQDGLAKRIVDRYRRNPDVGIKVIIQKEVLNPNDQLRLLDTLGQSSSSFSIWTEVQSTVGNRRFFSVIEPDEEGILRTAQFSM